MKEYSLCSYTKDFYTIVTQKSMYTVKDVTRNGLGIFSDQIKYFAQVMLFNWRENSYVVIWPKCLILKNEDNCP